MTTPADDPGPAERVLILAPTGQDAERLRTALAAAGIEGRIVRDLPALAAAIDAAMPVGPGAVLLAEEAVDRRHDALLREALQRQPPWSDLPVILLLVGGTSPPERQRSVEAFTAGGTVAILDRPFRTLTLVNAVQVALRSRRRQYEMRDHLARQARTGEELARKAGELERSNSDLEQFAAVVSHDLQEPLRMITAYLDLLQRRHPELADGDSARHVTYITDAALRMRAMIRAILEYSRIGTRRPDLAAIDSGAALADAQANLRAKLEGRGATVTAARDMPQVRSDPALLTQLFQNLISNAIKFCERVPRIAVAADRAGDAWEFSVSDNGIGIAPEAIARMFKLFQRLHPSRFHGTGIGLATCKRIVEIHGGSISVTSMPGQGSTFRFTIPD